MRLKEAGEWVAIKGGYRDGALKKTKRGGTTMSTPATNSIPKFQSAVPTKSTTTTTTRTVDNKNQRTRKSKPPTPPESAASPTMRAPKKQPLAMKSRTPEQPKPTQSRPERRERTAQQISAAAAAERRVNELSRREGSGISQSSSSAKNKKPTQPDRK